MHTKTRFRFVVNAALLFVAVLLAVTGSGVGQALAAPAAGVLPPSTACTGMGSGTVTCNLWAKTGTLTLPGSVTVPVWGYADSAGGSVQVPGPVLEAVTGDTVTVNLTNNLGPGRSTSLAFEGQAMMPDTTGVGDGLTKSYTFSATAPGTFLYEAGPLANAQHQVPMGLYGALIVRPAGLPGQAYTNPETAFNDEALVVLSEIDPALNTSANPATFDLRNYKPKYWLINGKAYPQTTAIDTLAGNEVLLRYVNAGQQPHTMALLGAYQKVLGKAGAELPFYRQVVSEVLSTGQSMDAIVSIPASAPAGTRFALYEGSMLLHNNGAAGFGGMLTFLTIPGGAPGPDTLGPAASALGLAPNPTNGSVDVALTASISDAGRGDNTIAAAEYFIDAPGANGTGLAFASGVPAGSSTTSVGASITIAQLAALASGNHPIYVHGQDAAGNWGPFNSIVLNLDKTGPATSGVSLNPATSTGTVNVALQATGNDTASGNSNVTAAEYFIDAPGANGTGTAMTPNQVAPTVSFNATISAATMGTLAEGAHAVHVHSRDALGNWGAFSTATLGVDKTGPVATGVSAIPSPNNGTLSATSTTQSVRVDVTLNDPLSGMGGGIQSAVKGAEGFIDTVGAPGAGFAFTPNDGIFNSPSNEKAYAFIPLSTVRALSNGSHTIYVRGKDAAGNWGGTGTAILIVDKVAPTVTGLTLNPSAASNTAVGISAVASDTASGNLNIVAGEYFIDTAGANGTGIVMSVSAAAPVANLNATISASTVAALAVGNHRVYVHAKDAAGNWGTRASATLVIDRTSPTFSGITLTPNSITAGTASVTLTVNGASDGAGGSGVTGGAYWICPTTCTNPGIGGGTAFTGLTASIPTGSLTAGHQYTVRARIRDAAGNWSTGVNSAGLTVILANNIFTDGFESGTLPGNWSSRSTTTTSRLNATTGAVLFGAYGMQAQGNNTNYVQYNFTPAAATYDARFYFRPNGNSSTGQDIFSAATSSGFGTTLFRVRYRLSGATPQVQIQVGTANTNTTWANITGGTANNVIEVLWQSGATLQLYLNGTLSQTLTANTGSVAAVRMGSVTNGGNVGLEYFDAFASKRTASPLIGP